MELLFPKKEIFPNQERSAKKKKKNFFFKKILKKDRLNHVKKTRKKSHDAVYEVHHVIFSP